jgi:hypothetical protein
VWRGSHFSSSDGSKKSEHLIVSNPSLGKRIPVTGVNMVKVTDNSFLLFVYPFLFTPAEFNHRVSAIEEATYTFSGNDEQQGTKVWEILDFPGDEMLAYVADYLNPPIPDTNSPDPKAQLDGAKLATARLWRLCDRMQPVYGLAGWADWRLRMDRKSDIEEFTQDAVIDPFGLVVKLRDGSDPISQFIRSRLSPLTLELLRRYEPTKPQIKPLLEPLLHDLNQIVRGPWLYDDPSYAPRQSAEKDAGKLKRPTGEKATVAANRSLLENAYPTEFLGRKVVEIPFRFGELAKNSRKTFAVQLALFKVGVGLLTVRVSPESHDISDWLTFLSVFRHVRGQRSNSVRAQKRGRDSETGIIRELPFFPEPAGGTDLPDDSDGQRHFIEILDALLHTADLPNNEGQWWQEVFIPEQTLPFATLFVDGLTPDQIPPLIYKLRNFFPSWQGPNPAPEDLRLDNPTLIPYAANQWFIFSLDGGAFLACDAPREIPRDREFFMKTLPDHLRDQYFILFVLVLHQRFLLMSLSQQVAETWPKVRSEAKVKDFEPIRDTLLEFAARGMFTQVMQREHHHRCYRKWQEVFQIKDLYDEVRDEVREMHDFLRMKRAEEILALAEDQRTKLEAQAEADAERERREVARERRIELRFKLITLVFGVPALVIGFLGINLVGITTDAEGVSFWGALLLCMGCTALGGLLMLLINRVRENIGDSNQTAEIQRTTKETSSLESR